MSLLLRLLLGHMVGDYVLQPLQLVVMKQRGWRGVLVHVAVVVVVTVILLLPILDHWWYWLWLMFLAVSHIIIDGSRALLLTYSERRGLLYLAIDQALHVSVLAVIAAVTHASLARNTAIPALSNSPHWDHLIAYMIGLIFLIWTVPVVERETMNALLTGEERIAIAASDRWLGALERVGGVALMLVGLEYLVPFAFVPRVLLQRAEWYNSPLQMRFFAKTAISFSSAVLAGILLAKIPLPFF
ncbi:MAG: hypothetical protein CEE40_12535 [Chloroflexi bacterium B3_Chlor]|nr:MAG: hypothetical protein CEE40_12535 [Chloroflexi bacterium B3_Chlor]